MVDDVRSKITPYVVAVAVQVIYAGLFIVSKAAFDNGINTSVFVFYRLAVATAFLLPIAFIDSFCGRRHTTAAPALSCRLLFKLFLYAVLGNTFSLNVYSMSLKNTSATVASAVSNCMPVITFLLALSMGMETMKLRARSGMGKLAGIILCLAGVLVIAFYAGPSVRPLADHPFFPTTHSGNKPHIGSGVWIRGTFLPVLASATLCLWIVLQVPLLKEYPNKLVATAMQCLFGAIQSFVVAVVVERDFSKWKLGLDIGLLAVLYSAFFATGALMYLMAWCAEMEGPVFLVMWTPLSLVITLFCSFFFLGEVIYLGSILGGILLVGGLYSVLWSKSKEKKNKITPTASTVQEKHEEELISQVV